MFRKDIQKTISMHVHLQALPKIDPDSHAQHIHDFEPNTFRRAARPNWDNEKSIVISDQAAGNSYSPPRG
jgi:hypothetical protein